MTILSKKNDFTAGDPFANHHFNNIFKELYTPLCRFTMKYVADKATAEDIVQDLFVYLWEHWERLSSISSIKAYLFISAKNKSISYLKRPFTKQNVEALSYDIEHILTGHFPGPDELIANQELQSILENALETLPTKCRAIFTLKRFGELSNKEISNKLNISVKTVEAQMTIAIKRIMVFVKSHWQFVLLLSAEYLRNLIK
jgi:RNA polymerase sigma-70 factor (ECF subfamily)